MPKNIVIFSDGTGQAGGINFDEARTNVYKLYRASRVGPDTKIEPSEQVAFYDPGLGSASDGGHFTIGWMRWLYNLASMATGLGITRNIVDCYAAIISLYEEGDRIFLIGFSRGAYTVRSVAGVMTHCGIPRHLPDGSPLRRDPKSIHELAEHAVKDVYQFCPSYSRKDTHGYWKFLKDTRDAIAAEFRRQHGSSKTIDDVEQANVVPYFIGVFDTVAALGHKYLGWALFGVGAAVLIGLHYFGSWLEPTYPWAGHVTRDLSYLGIFTALILTLKNYLKIAPPLPGSGFFKRLATLHLAPPKHKFYDTTLNPNVGYAKHAISIDENRADFKRVPWSPTAARSGRDSHGNLYFEQVWFPGVHADVGGGYLENEARLSDVALNWMVAGASIIPDGFKHDGNVLRLSPDPAGPQHNEQATSFLKLGVRPIPVDQKTGLSTSPMHKSVYRRFEAASVLLYDRITAYRPDNMRVHIDFSHYFDQSPAPPPQCTADDIEMKWKNSGYVGRL
ncbi:DUF2235 domain-containing protein [Bradyrhizobium japonicum]|uniref:DUF2235 domain-containing protein n=1 Tax=Bradyrhizobium japonicum TaxID=375 RepID=UPI00068D9CD5|nr:DUF2235 domain-containing protein [Bradyrhizobium japonicum]MCD9110301.1 DUF2235 domain-containing protein [Bradyrhizobium japonicum]MCD9257480.1 DUF2235 domain-containing protein [Bradyrhizobium japonicum SEMIA 5079]MCD9823530.1 DUF2235 domain-containing protein [Bradyrhizobium japonicum]MCD9895144.1 DUF2235 domain-containing protein [Bradyrhizobium japonicum]MCD9910750.1 DUF2235 domain-containing protein [Bradyrhizobium japonicum]